MFCENWHLAPDVSESALSVSCSCSLLSIKTRVFCSSVFFFFVCLGFFFFVVVCLFQRWSGNDKHHMTEEDFH